MHKYYPRGTCRISIILLRNRWPLQAAIDATITEEQKYEVVDIAVLVRRDSFRSEFPQYILHG